MVLQEYNVTTMPQTLLDLTTSSTHSILLGTLLNKTIDYNRHANYHSSKTIPSPLPETSDNTFIDVTFSNHDISSTVTSSISSFLITTSGTTEVPGGVVHHNSDSTIMAKMTALLVITAVVLVISYRFVVRLFLGYTDRKDDVLPDGLSDEEEDSAVVKRVPERYLEV